MDIKHLFTIDSQFKNKDQIILRDYLALERTKLANERTLLAYIRSSLYLLIGGIALLQLEDFESIYFLGYTSIALAVLFICFGIYRYYRLRRRLKIYYYEIDLKEKE